jgi:hypothetical protein
MEKRSEPRLDENRPVRVTVLRDPQRELIGRIENISGRGMRVLVNAPIAGREPIKLEWEGTLLLGEVCYCEAAPGGYGIGLELEHALLHTHELSRLARRLAGDREMCPEQRSRSVMKRPHAMNHGNDEDR